MNPEKMFHKWGLIGQVSIVGTVLIIILGLLAVSLFYFFSLKEEDQTRTQTAPNLKLLTSHSHPEAGEEWGVSFETAGAADLTITPEDQDSINDLDFVFLSCDGKEKAGAESPQILEGDVIFYLNWQCAGKGEVVHLVNIARKHTLKFQFSNKMAYAYNNPDSVTDTFDNEDYIASKENITISGGQAELAICGDNGGGCSVDGDCCSNNCDNSICCAEGQTCCTSHNHCPPDSACNGICTRIDNYCDTATDHYCKIQDIDCDPKYKCVDGSCDYASCDTSPNCDKICSNGSCIHQSSSQDYWSQCSHTCNFNILNDAEGIDCDSKCSNSYAGHGNCNDAGSCGTRNCNCDSIGIDSSGTNSKYCKRRSVREGGACTSYSGSCGSTMTAVSGGDCSCGYTSHAIKWTVCSCE